MSKSLWHDPVQLIHGLSTRLLKQWHDITENVNISYFREGNDSIHIYRVFKLVLKGIQTINELTLTRLVSQKPLFSQSTKLHAVNYILPLNLKFK